MLLSTVTGVVEYCGWYCSVLRLVLWHAVASSGQCCDWYCLELRLVLWNAVAIVVVSAVAGIVQYCD